MYELASAGDLPLPRPSPPASNKRDRGPDTLPDTPESGGSPSVVGSEEPRHIAGSKRVSSAVRLSERLYHQQANLQTQQQSQIPSQHLTLPMDAMNTGAPPLANQLDINIANGNLGQASNAMSIGFPSGLGGWYGYDSADASRTPAASASMFGNGVDAQPSTSQQVGAALAPMNAQFQTLDLGHMLSMQSMMYDQVLSNPSASLGETPGSSLSLTRGHAQTQHAQAQQQPMDDSRASPDNFTELLASFGENYGAIFPDFNDGTLNFSTWSNVPQGFE